MTVLSKLNRSDKTRAAMLNGETFIRRAMRWMDDPETGERIRQKVPVRSRPLECPMVRLAIPPPLVLGMYTSR